jgi:ribosomal protein S25
VLLQIRDYISREKLVSTQQLSREFKIDFSALQPILAWWVGKGVIMRCAENNRCAQACFKCSTPIEYYKPSN